MPAQRPTPQALRTAYRHLYKAALRAVQYTVPQRFVVRDKLRAAFRAAPRPARPTTAGQAQFDPRRIANTIAFLETAAARRGLEHKLVKNLCLTWYHAHYRRKRYVPTPLR